MVSNHKNFSYFRGFRTCTLLSSCVVEKYNNCKKKDFEQSRSTRIIFASVWWCFVKQWDRGICSWHCTQNRTFWTWLFLHLFHTFISHLYTTFHIYMMVYYTHIYCYTCQYGKNTYIHWAKITVTLWLLILAHTSEITLQYLQQ